MNPIRKEGKDFRISKLNPGDKVLGVKTKGDCFVQCYEDGLEMSGSFWQTWDEAIIEVEEFMGIPDENRWANQ